MQIKWTSEGLLIQPEPNEPPVDEQTVLTTLGDFFVFCQEYDMEAHPRPKCEWLQGRDLMHRWGVTGDQFSGLLKGVPGQMWLSGFLVDRTTKQMIREEAAKDKELRKLGYRDSIDHGQAHKRNQAPDLNTYLETPAVWWFKRSEYEFYEKCNQDIRRRLLDSKSLLLTTNWLSVDELRERWEIGPFSNRRFTLEDLIIHKGLVGYALWGYHGFGRMDPVAVRRPSSLFAVDSDRLFGVMFRMRDVHRVEAVHGKELFGLGDKEVWELRLVDYVTGWKRRHPHSLQKCDIMRLLRSECRHHITESRHTTYQDILSKHWTYVKGPKKGYRCPYNESHCFAVFASRREDNPSPLECEVFQKKYIP
jgi:hypothetical protein